MGYQKSNGNPKKIIDDLLDAYYLASDPQEKIKIREKIDNLYDKTKKTTFLEDDDDDDEGGEIKNGDDQRIDDERLPPVMLFGVNLRGADSSSSSTTTATASDHHSQKERIIEEYDFFDQERKGPIRKHILPPLIAPLKEIIFPQIIMPQPQESKTRSKSAAPDNYNDDSWRCDSERSCMVEEETRAMRQRKEYSFLDHHLKRSTTGIDDQKKTKKVSDSADHNDDDSVPTRRNRKDGKVIRLFGVDICVDSSTSDEEDDQIKN